MHFSSTCLIHIVWWYLCTHLALPTNSPSPPSVTLSPPLSWVVSKNAFMDLCKQKQNMIMLHAADKQSMITLHAADKQNMITLHAADKQTISIKSTKVIMSLITQRNGFIFKGYCMTLSRLQATLIPCFMDIILSTKTVCKLNTWKMKNVAVRVTAYWPMCMPDPLCRPSVCSSDSILTHVHAWPTVQTIRL